MKPTLLSEMPSNNLGNQNNIHETRPKSSVQSVALPLGNNTNNLTIPSRTIVKNRTRRDLVLPLLSGLLLGLWERFYDMEKGYKSLKIGFQQAFSVLSAEFIVGSFPAISTYSELLEEYSVDIFSSLLFGAIEWFLYKERGFKAMSMNAIFSFLSLQIAKYIEDPIRPYLPHMIKNFQV